MILNLLVILTVVSLFAFSLYAARQSRRNMFAAGWWASRADLHRQAVEAEAGAEVMMFLMLIGNADMSASGTTRYDPYQRWQDSERVRH